MRTRTEIEDDVNTVPNGRLVLEVVLDIRDMMEEAEDRIYVDRGKDNYGIW